MVASTPESPEKIERVTRPREWWHRYLAPEERRRVMNDLAIVPQASWNFRFGLMMTLAVVVATMGLLANSAAVVIGAMLLAPLMVPVLGTAAALSMGLPKKSLQALSRVVLATLWSIFVAYVLAALFASGPFGSEILGRTRPDIKDLVVALAAGFAGSYATVRRDVSAALPGVAVAVALVPPLAVVGVTLEANSNEFARGALLLFVTNLVAIILAGVLTFVLTGFVPPRRLAATTPRIVAATVISIVAVVAVALPLIQASTSAAEASLQEQEVSETIDLWISGLALQRSSYDIQDGRISVVITGPDSPPDDSELQTLLVPIIGDVIVDVQWTMTQRATTTTIAPTTTTLLSDEENRTNEATSIVSSWLAEVTTEDYELQGVYLDEDQHVRIVATGVGDPPDSSASDILRSRLSDAGFVDGFRLNWTPSIAVFDGTVPPTPIEVREQAMIAFVNADLADSGTTLQSLTFDGTEVNVELIGSEQPNATELTEELQRLAGDVIPINLYFVERVRLATTTTTVPTTTTTESN